MNGIRRAVAAIDFGGHGMEGARWTARYLKPDMIYLVHALHLPRPPSFLEGLWGDEEQVELSARAGAAERLEEFGRQLARETGAKVETRLRTGPPAEQIAEAARSVEADVIVLGPHSRRHGHWDRLGSTADRVLHQARLPTLLATGTLREPRLLLAAIDDSAADAGVLGWSRALSDLTGARAAALHVIDNTTEMTYRAILAPSVPGRETELERKASGWLESRLTETGIEGVEAHVALGDPPLEILAAAERLGADLLILGTRAAGAAGRLLMGSVARQVVRGARCPVWLVPLPE